MGVEEGGRELGDPLLSCPSTAARVAARRSALHGLLVLLVDDVAAVLLLLVEGGRGEAASSRWRCGRGAHGADPSPAWPGPAAGRRRPAAAAIWWRAAAPARGVCFAGRAAE